MDTTQQLHLQLQKELVGQDSIEAIELNVPPSCILDGNMIDGRDNITTSGCSSSSSSSSSGNVGLSGYEYTLQEGESFVNSMYQVPAAPTPALHMAPQHKMTTNTSMTSTIPAPPMSNHSLSSNATGGVTPGSNTSSKSKSRQQKQSQAEIHRTWENEYVTDHLMRGHMNYCFAWLDNGVCPQYMVSGVCCYIHTYPNSWTEEMIKKHGVIKTYMDDLYRGCDILELVGRGKKSTALMTSKGTASIIAEAIDAKIDAMEQPVQPVTTKRGRDKLSQ